MSSAFQLAFVVYFVVIATISIVALRRTRDAGDYAIGGRALTAPVAALSAGASDMSGWLLLGLPGAVYAAGLAESWIVVGLVLGAWLNWTFVAPRLRTFTEGVNAITLPQFFTRRLDSQSSALTLSLNLVATGAVLVFFAVYTSAGFVAGAKLFVSTLGLSYATALWTGAAVIMLYTAAGGFLAVSWTDLVQALLMVTALVLVPLLAAMVEVTGPAGPAVFSSGNLDLGWLATVSLLAWGLGYFGQPHVLARFFAIKSAASIPAARRVGMTWMVVASIGAIAVGLTGRTVFVAAPLDDPETVFLALTELTLNPWFAGLVMAAILAAVMSTVDSQLLVASTTVVEDCLRPLVPDLSASAAIWTSRAMVILMALCAAWIATDPDSQVLGLVAYAWAGLGASFGPAVLFCLFWRATTAAGVIAGIIVGAGVTIGWRNLDGGLFEMYELLPAFAFASAAIYAVSLLGSDARASKTFDVLFEARGGPI